MAANWKTLNKWQNTGKSEVSEEFSSNSKIGRLNAAARNGETVKIIYRGGSTPGASRKIKPKEIFVKQGYDPVYVEAFCKTREANRTFRLDKISIISTASTSKNSESKIVQFIVLAIIILAIYYIFN
jgi:predicted DNA-binding transcriptional regulator YafY